MENLSTLDEDFLIPQEGDFDPENQYNYFKENVVNVNFDVSHGENLELGCENEPENKNFAEVSKKYLYLKESFKSEESSKNDFKSVESYSVFEEGGEEGEVIVLQEQEIASLALPLTEQSEEEVQSLVSDNFFEVPAEVLQEREAMISKLKELWTEQPALKQKNKLLEFWVVKHMAKVRAMLVSSYLNVESNKTLEFPVRVIRGAQRFREARNRRMMQTNQKITPKDVSMQFEELNLLYKKTLRMYQQDSERILAMQNQLQMEVDNYENKVQEVLDRDERAFQDLIDQERIIGVGLKFSMSAKQVSEIDLKNLVLRQIKHREMLMSCRINHTRHHYLLEDLTKKLAKIEKLRPDKTFQDFHILRSKNVIFKEKVDEQTAEVEKLRAKIYEANNKIAYFKEKDYILMDNIDEWSEKLDTVKVAYAIETKHLNKLRLQHKKLIRPTRNKKTGRFLDIPQSQGFYQGIKTLENYKDNNSEIRYSGKLAATSAFLTVSKTKSMLKPGRG